MLLAIYGWFSTRHDKMRTLPAFLTGGGAEDAADAGLPDYHGTVGEAL
jgi:hypothetical protein